MNTKQIAGAVVSTILKVVIAILVIFYVYQGAMVAYDYGYRVFMEPAMTTEEQGWDITVEISAGDSAKEIGEILVAKGLVRDANLFYIQNLLSEYAGELQPGIYTLNTSMTGREMMAIMAEVPEETEESDDN